MSLWTLKFVVAVVPWLALYVATIRLRSPFDLGDVTVGVGARRRDAVAWRVGRGAGEVVALLDGDHEERVGLGDAVVLQAGEEVGERLVVVLELLDVAGLAGTVRVVDLAGDAVRSRGRRRCSRR